MPLVSDDFLLFMFLTRTPFALAADLRPKHGNASSTGRWKGFLCHHALNFTPLGAPPTARPVGNVAMWTIYMARSELVSIRC